MQDISRQPLLSAAVDRAPVGMAVFDEQLRYLHVNAALAELNRLPVADHLGRHVSDVVPPHVAARLEPVLREVLETGLPRHGVDFQGGAPADPRSWEGSIFPVGGNGHAGGVGVLLVETTERDRALARARYLARASAALGSSLALDETLHTVAQLAVPEVADWAFVELVQADGSITRVAWAHADASLAATVPEYDERSPLG